MTRLISHEKSFVGGILNRFNRFSSEIKVLFGFLD